MTDVNPEVVRPSGNIPSDVSAALARFPNQEHLVPRGGYELLDGSDEPIVFDPTTIKLSPNEDYPHLNLLPGTYFRGFYDLANGSSISILSFLYYKRDSAGRLETVERAIVNTGTGYGEHPGHPGQPPTWYLIGPQIGIVDPVDGKFIVTEVAGMEIQAKHFSVACIANGPLGEPVLANPS